jgi:hypothetical protein
LVALVVALILVALVVALILVVLVVALILVALVVALIVVTTRILGLAVVLAPSVARLALVPGGTVRGCSRRRGHGDDRMRRCALHGRRRNGDRLRAFVRARCAQRHQKARGNGQRDGARRCDEMRRIAKRVRKVRSDQIRLRGQQR